MCAQTDDVTIHGTATHVYRALHWIDANSYLRHCMLNMFVDLNQLYVTAVAILTQAKLCVWIFCFYLIKEG